MSPPGLIRLIIYVVITSVLVHCASNKLLIVGIFSAPDHFNERLALRRTWLKLILDEPSVCYYFIIGRSLCHVPPHERKTPYGCEQAKTVTDAKFKPLSTGTEQKMRVYSFATGFGFRADHDIVVTHLGLPKCVIERLSAPARVKLIDAYDQKELASISFSALNEENNIKAIQPVAFPRLSEGMLLVKFVEPRDDQLCKCSKLKCNEAELVSFSSILLERRNVIFDNNTNVCAFMLYHQSSKVIGDDEKEATEDSWQRKTNQIYDDIEKEQQKTNDILIVNTTEYYSNLPQKLLSFIRYADGEEFDFMLKTDDDTFVDIPRVVAELKNVKTGNLWWWSAFKEYHQVPLAGKWQEKKYVSATYPPYPCGGGYILNRQALRFLSSVSDHLATFQGEDVSLGVWLAATKIERHRPSGKNMSNYKGIMLGLCEEPCQWVCDRSAKQGTCNHVQLSLTEMYNSWRIYLKHRTLI